jgi:hypothetical protein
MVITIRITLMMLTPTRILRCQCYWWRHLLTIQEGLALLQIVSYGVMDHTPLLGIIGTLERPLILLLRGVLTVISVISSILAVSPVSGVDLSIILHP